MAKQSMCPTKKHKGKRSGNLTLSHSRRQMTTSSWHRHMWWCELCASTLLTRPMKGFSWIEMWKKHFAYEFCFLADHWCLYPTHWDCSGLVLDDCCQDFLCLFDRSGRNCCWYIKSKLYTWDVWWLLSCMEIYHYYCCFFVSEFSF